MCRNLRLRCVAAVLAVSAFVPSLTSATNVSHVRANTDIAIAVLLDKDSTGCLWTYSEIMVTEVQMRNEPGLSPPSTWLSLYIMEVDACHGHDPTGYELHTATYIPAHTFHVNPGLQSASLQLTVEAGNRSTGVTESVTLDVIWAGEGDIYRGHSNSQSTFPGGRAIERTFGSDRFATPSGSITLPSRNLTGANHTFGRLETSQSAITYVQ